MYLATCTEKIQFKTTNRVRYQLTSVYHILLITSTIFCYNYNIFYLNGTNICKSINIVFSILQ